MKKLIGVLASAVLTVVIATASLASAQTQSLGSDTFTDVPKGHWADEAIGWAVENEITSGTSDTTFSPNDTLTRAQMVTFLHRYHTELGDSSVGVPTQEVSVSHVAGGTGNYSQTHTLPTALYRIDFVIHSHPDGYFGVKAYDSGGYCELLLNESLNGETSLSSEVLSVGDGRSWACAPGKITIAVDADPSTRWSYQILRLV